MTNKQNVLEAWTIMERFSEGDIDLAEGGNVKLKKLPTVSENWTTFFTKKINEFKESKTEEMAKDSKVSQKENFKNIGFSIFFDVFRFDDLINDLSSKFKLSEEYRDDSNSSKFTYCVSFMLEDDSFRLVEDSLFHTVSGYAHRQGDLNAEIETIEIELRKQLAELFEYDFEKGIGQLIASEVSWSTQNYYEIQEDVTKADPLLHSFYINDLELAKQKESVNLDRYLFGFSGERVNLDTDKGSESFNPEALTTVLEPKNYPLGRFPSNPEWGLSLMQQVAVNLTLNDENDLRGVNGPPGTGKTTLLKDVFAELVVRQAKQICGLSDRHLNETETYFKSGKIARLPEGIADKNILVASSNNGAVRNIVKELPQEDQIDQQFMDDVLRVDYFTNISNDEESNGNWGTFATEGGKSDNRKKMIEMIKQMTNELKSEEFTPNQNAYQEFSNQYKLVKEMRGNAQKVADSQKKLIQLQSQLVIKTKKYQQELATKQAKYNENRVEEKETLEKLDLSITQHENQLLPIEEARASNASQLDLLKSNLALIKEQKPFGLFFLKMVNHSAAKAYIEQLSTGSQSMMALIEEQKNIEKDHKNELKRLAELKNKREKQHRLEKSLTETFTVWQRKGEEELRSLEEQISPLESQLKEANIRPLDLAQSYSGLQQDNPWFGKEYRVEQSKLFIAALAVRKQFLYENVKSLNGSYNIWNKMSDYTIPEKKYLIQLAWDWINFAIPVISTTFASFHGMFKNMDTDSIANLFIDEAGQATPQSAVGAILRSKRVVAVGDPAQITPVIPLSNGIIGLIASSTHASENIVNGYASVQTLLDDASKFGYQKTEEEWIGIPLWVHRRCLDPMFSISNNLSYEGKMVLPEMMSKPGKGAWIDIKGSSNNKFVKEQAEWLKEELTKRFERMDEKEKSNIYVISPFTNVVTNLKRVLGPIGFKKANIGTVHTFQGKEAAIVYLVLGASPEESGAARWAVTEPNLMNVAATRAKKEFYVIGDRELYQSLKLEVVSKTLEVIDVAE